MLKPKIFLIRVGKTSTKHAMPVEEKPDCSYQQHFKLQITTFHDVAVKNF